MNSEAKKKIFEKDWDRVCEIYAKVLELPAPDRNKFLEEQSKSQPDICEQVKELLDSESVSQFMESPLSMSLVPLNEIDESGIKPGDSVEDFEIIKKLGTGGFGSVYLAHQRSLNRKVAVKISPNLGNEAKTMAQLNHEHIVSVYSETVDAEKDLRFICMEFVPGAGLDAVLDKLLTHRHESPKGATFLEALDELVKDPMTFDPVALKDREFIKTHSFLEVVLWIGQQQANALAYAHERGVLHLDVKPSNILLTPYGRPLLTDFNISMQTQENRKNQMLGGSADYMPPEQEALFKEATRSTAIETLNDRADVFALGKVLKECLQLEKNPLPIEVKQLLDQCLNRDPMKRPSAKELGDRLEACRELIDIHNQLPPMGAVSNWAMKHPLIALTITTSVPQVLAVFVGIMYNTMRIISFLNAKQQMLFDSLNIYYNPAIYVLASAYWGSVLWRLYRYLRSPQKYSPREVSRLRKLVLRLPTIVVWLTTVGWLPASFVFPISLKYFGGSLSNSVFLHFLISFGLSWLIALSYSYIAAQYFGLRILYPRFWLGCRSVRRNAARELPKLEKNSNIFFVLTGLVPLIATALVVFIGGEGLENTMEKPFRMLLGGLIALGILGVFVGLRINEKWTRTLLIWKDR